MPPAADDEAEQAQPLPLRRVQAQGVLVHLLNPKTAIFFFFFFFAFLPQFGNLDPGMSEP